MRTFAALLVLASAAWAQKKIEGTVKETVVEKRPAFLIEGTTDLPDTSRLDIHVFFDGVVEGRHLAYIAIEAKGGKFSLTLPVFAEKTLSGSYVVRVAFPPYNQQREVQEALGRNLRHYEAQLPFVHGTEEDAVKDRRRVFARLGGEINALRDIVEAAVAKYKDRPALDQWRRLAKEWEEKIHAIEKAVQNVPEYKAVRIDDISESLFEDMAQSVHRLIDSAGASLEKPDDAERSKLVDEHRRGFDWMRRPVALRLGVEKATAKELAAMVPSAGDPVSSAAQHYLQAVKRADSDGREYFKARLILYKKDFQQTLLTMSEIAPERYQEAIRSLLTSGTAFFKILEEGRELKENRSDDVKDALDKVKEQIEKLSAALKE